MKKAVKRNMPDDKKSKDIIAKPFFTWIGSLVFLSLLVIMQDDIGIFEDIDFVAFCIGIFVGALAFTLTIINIFKTKSIFYLIATIPILVFIFYFLMYG
jgi:hypothetical protein